MMTKEMSLVESAGNGNIGEDEREDVGDGDGDDKVLNETEQFARNIDVDIGAAIDEDLALPPKHDASGDISVDEEMKDDAVVVEALKEKKKDDGGEVVRVGEKCDIFGDAGVAAALARFRSMGNLNRKSEQYGRAKDKRIDVNEPGTVRLNYTDDTGRELTAKEAFRLMCHKFHGKGPSKNKRETRMRRELRELRLKQMETDDTPLGSTSALREETRRTGVAHVVLSGASAALDSTQDKKKSALSKGGSSGGAARK